MNTLVLNVSYEVVGVVGWQRAITLVLSGKADVLEESAHRVRSISQEWTLPLVVRLKKWVRAFRSKRKWSKSVVLKRDEYKCQYCNRTLTDATATIDHVLPRARNGQTVYENTVACCERCNQRKEDRLPEEVGMKLIKIPRFPDTQSLLEKEFRSALERIFG